MIGLVLLYLLLICRIIKIEWVDSLANTLIGLIAFLFVLSDISLTANLKIMQTAGLKLVFIIILSTIILLVVTAYTARALLWLKSKLQAPEKTSSFGHLETTKWRSAIMMTYLTNPLFGVALSLVLFIIWQGLFKISKGFFLFQPLFFAMITGILVLVVMAHGFNMSPKAFYTKAYKQGGI